MSEQNKMLVFERKDAIQNCKHYDEGDCAKDNGEHSCNDKYCPLPDYDWKEKLLEWIEENEGTVYERDIEFVDLDALKQKIKEM
jgi:hypothetical protein